MKKALRVGFITPYYPPRVIGGMEISVSLLARALVRAGHTLRVFTLNYGSRETHVEGENPRIYRFGWPSDRRMWPTRNPFAYRRLARYIVATHEPLDIIDAYALFPPAIRLSKKLNIPAVVSVRDASVIDRGSAQPQFDRPFVYIQKRIRRAGKFSLPEFLYALYGLYLRSSDCRAIRRADMATFQSEALRDLLRGVWRKSVVIKSIALDALPQGKAPAISGIDFFKERVVLYAGRIADGKGVKVLYEAAQCLVAADYSDVKFLFVGTGPLQAYLEHGPLGNRAVFPGRLSHEATLRLIQKSTVTVIPSKIFENFPRLAIESIALGVPVIGTRMGGIPEAIGSAGILVPPDDVIALSHALKTVLTQPQIRTQLQNEARKQAQYHTPEYVVQKILHMYFQLI